MSTASISDRAREVARLYKTGLSTRDIAPLLNISSSTAALDLAKAGVTAERIERIRAKAIGRPSHRKGAKLPPEFGEAISLRMTGHKNNIGSKRTDDQKANMSRAAVARAKRPGETERRRAVMLVAEHPRRLPADEREKRAKVRNACKRMLRRVLVMARTRKDLPTEAMLGYSQSELRAHIEGQFRPGMCWTVRDSFHIDHKLPVAEFFRRGIFDPKLINALDNLQVLTPDENRKKSDRVITISNRGTEPGIQRI